MFSKRYILPVQLVLICLLLFAAIPFGGTSLVEVLACLSAFGVTGWLVWYLFMERKAILVQVESLKNDYKGQRDKA